MSTGKVESVKYLGAWHDKHYGQPIETVQLKRGSPLSDLDNVPPGLNSCLCAACGECFTSPSAFDRHQTQDKVDGEMVGVLCHDPAERGLVLTERGPAQDRWLLWSWPAPDASVWEPKAKPAQNGGKAKRRAHSR